MFAGRTLESTPSAGWGRAGRGGVPRPRPAMGGMPASPAAPCLGGRNSLNCKMGSRACSEALGGALGGALLGTLSNQTSTSIPPPAPIRSESPAPSPSARLREASPAEARVRTATARGRRPVDSDVAFGGLGPASASGPPGHWHAAEKRRPSQRRVERTASEWRGLGVGTFRTTATSLHARTQWSTPGGLARPGLASKAPRGREVE